MSPVISRKELIELARRAGPESPLHELLAKSARRPKRSPTVELPSSLGRTFCLSVPMPVSLSNASGRSRQFFTVGRFKKQYFRLLDRRLACGLIAAPPTPSFGRCAIDTTMYLGARMDMDNAMARHKWPLDWLQEHGYLVNDRYVEWLALPVQVVNRGQEYRIEITLTEPKVGS